MMSGNTILHKVRKGINIKSFFSYGDDQIPIRAISSVELDESRLNSISILDDKLSRFILRMRLGQFDGKKIDVDSVPPDMWKNYLKYIWEFDYWVVYYGMMDFQPIDFTIDDVRGMRLVHEMASKIIKMSSASDIVLTEFIETKEGEQLAKIIYEFKQPLNSENWKLTPLQHRFLVLTDPKAPKKVANSMEELEKILPSIGDAMYHARR